MNRTDQQAEGTLPLDAAGSSLGKRDSDGGGVEQPVTKKSRDAPGDVEPPRDVPDDEDADLARAIQLSLEGTAAQDRPTSPSPDRQRTTSSTAASRSSSSTDV